jgi:hypothetical protein
MSYQKPYINTKINHYFDWSLWRSGYECDDLKKRGQDSLECSRDPCEAVRRLGDEFKSLLDSSTISSIAIVAHDHENKQSSCCSSSSQLIDTLTVVSIKLFELDSERPQCDWGRLVALLAFGSLLSLHCHRLERPDLDVDVVRKWLIHEFFARNRLVQRWIESRQGGWVRNMSYCIYF